MCAPARNGCRKIAGGPERDDDIVRWRSPGPHWPLRSRSSRRWRTRASRPWSSRVAAPRVRRRRRSSRARASTRPRSSRCSNGWSACSAQRATSSPRATPSGARSRRAPRGRRTLWTVELPRAPVLLRAARLPGGACHRLPRDLRLRRPSMDPGASDELRPEASEFVAAIVSPAARPRLGGDPAGERPATRAPTASPATRRPADRPGARRATPRPRRGPRKPGRCEATKAHAGAVQAVAGRAGRPRSGRGRVRRRRRCPRHRAQ